MIARKNLKKVAEILLKEKLNNEDVALYNKSMINLAEIGYPVLNYSILSSKEHNRLVSKLLYNQEFSEDSAKITDEKILLTQKSLGKVIYEDFNIEIEEEEIPLLKIFENKEDIDYFLNINVDESPLNFIMTKMKNENPAPKI